MGFDGAGAEAKQGVRHANANDTGGQDDDAQPTPNANGTRGRQDDQRQTSDDAKNAVNAANVLSHGDSLKGCGSG